MISPSSARKVAVATTIATLATFSIARFGMAGADASSPPPQPSLVERASALAASVAADFVGGRPAVLHASAADVFSAQAVIPSGGMQYMPYQRTYQGLRVIGGDFVVVLDGQGNVTATSVAQDQPISGVTTRPSVSANRAAQVARAQLTHVQAVTTPHLVVYAHGHSRLAWELQVTGTKANAPSKQSVYVDARTGKVISAIEHVLNGEGTAAYSGPNPVSLGTTKSGSGFAMTDPKIARMSCQDAASNRTFTGPDDKWGNGDASKKETGCVDALFDVQTETKMLSAWLGRNGPDGSGGAWPIRVGLDDLNAFYDGSQVQIGHNESGQWISSIDVVAHEYGHGIDDHTPGGTSNRGTQEFIADAFGAATEAYSNQKAQYDPPDFLVGEEVNLVGQGPIRNMYDPSQLGDPNCYSSNIPNTEVHAAAGPGNHWFYLLAKGSKPAGGPNSPTCNNSSVTGIGIQKAIKVLYNAMLMKTSSSSYLKYRTWTLTAAKNQFPGSCTEFTTVKAAWDAVSVPAQSGDPTCSGVTGG